MERNGERPDRFVKLAPGPGRPPAEVATHQLIRIRKAMIQIVADEGYEAVTVRKLTHLAGVSTQAFYRHFDSKQDCLLETYDQTVRGAARLVVAAARREDDWQGRLRASLTVYLQAIARYPRSARLVLLDVLAAGSPARERMRHTAGLSEAILHDGFADAMGSTVGHSLIVKGVVGGVMAVSRARLIEGRERELPMLADELTDWACSFGDIDLEGLDAGAPAWLTGQPDNVLRRVGVGPAAGAGDRELLIAATLKLARTERLADISPQKIRALAGVSKRAFDAIFGSAPSCLLAAIDQAVASIQVEAQSAYSTVPDWPSRIYRAIVLLCEAAASDRALARLGFTEALSLGPSAVRQRGRFVGRTLAMLRAGEPLEGQPSAVAGEASIGAIWTILEHQAVAGGPASLRRAAPTMAIMALAPTIGAEAAVAHARRKTGVGAVRPDTGRTLQCEPQQPAPERKIRVQQRLRRNKNEPDLDLAPVDGTTRN